MTSGATGDEFMYRKMDEFAQKRSPEQIEADRKMVAAGEMSVLDVEAPLSAIREYNRGLRALSGEGAKVAANHFQKAIKEYPSFVTAHLVLGLAYQGLANDEQARAEYELAAKLDPKYAVPLLALGRLKMAEEDLEAANTLFDQALTLQPNDPRVLAGLCYTQNGTKRYRQALETVVRLHATPHAGMGMAHYVAAAAAIALNERATIKRELELFVQEDPNNELVPEARRNIAILSAELGSAPGGGPTKPPPELR